MSPLKMKGIPDTKHVYMCALVKYQYIITSRVSAHAGKQEAMPSTSPQYNQHIF
jgi:hypothetical protein